MTGFSDLFQEFTGNDCSVRMLEFTIRRDEVDETMDDTCARVAGGKTFSWEILLQGNPTARTGGEFAMTATSLRNGETVSPVGDTPFFSYIWSSDDENVATVDKNGKVTAVGEGTCSITCTLNQNPDIWSAWPLTVEPATVGQSVDFLTTPPERLRAFENATMTAVCLLDGEPTEGTVEWSFSGADPSAYTVSEDGNTATISCWGGSVEPLTVTAAWGGDSVSVVIELEGI